jgi:hypothetical protein
MPRKAKYGVQFIGYSARVIAREKYGREVDYAMLDFVSGATSMHADGGWVMVPKRTDVEPFLKNLPKLANDPGGRHDQPVLWSKHRLLEPR